MRGNLHVRFGGSLLVISNETWLATQLLILPLIGVFLSFKPNSYYNNYYMNVIRGKNVSYYDFGKKNGYDDKGIYLKNVTLIITSLNLLISLVIFGLFNYNPSEFQFVQEHYNVSNFDIYLGVDGISIYFILLTTGIMPIALIST